MIQLFPIPFARKNIENIFFSLLQRTYEKFFGLLAQRLCQLKREYVEPFQNIFVDLDILLEK